MPGILRVDQANVDYIYAKTAGGKVYVPGHTIQIQQTVKNDVFSSSSTSYVDITGLSVSITPVSVNSKILVVANVKGQGGSNATTRLMRDSTAIFLGTASGSRTVGSGGDLFGSGSPGGAGQTNVHFFVDSPSTTSAITYKVQLVVYGSTAYINSTYNDSDASYTMRGASSITVMEIAQ
jgi:hypothetical protein